MSLSFVSTIALNIESNASCSELFNSVIHVTFIIHSAFIPHSFIQRYVMSSNFSSHLCLFRLNGHCPFVIFFIHVMMHTFKNKNEGIINILADADDSTIGCSIHNPVMTVKTMKCKIRKNDSMLLLFAFRLVRLVSFFRFMFHFHF